MRIVYEDNKIGTFEFLKFARKRGSKLIYAGSSTKFGDGGISRNISPCAWTKASNTELVINYGNWYGKNYAITYFYNVYGPKEISTGKYATLISYFIATYIGNLFLKKTRINFIMQSKGILTFYKIKGIL